MSSEDLHKSITFKLRPEIPLPACTIGPNPDSRDSNINHFSHFAILPHAQQAIGESAHLLLTNVLEEPKPGIYTILEPAFIPIVAKKYDTLMLALRLAEERISNDSALPDTENIVNDIQSVLNFAIIIGPHSLIHHASS